MANAFETFSTKFSELVAQLQLLQTAGVFRIKNAMLGGWATLVTPQMLLGTLTVDIAREIRDFLQSMPVFTIAASTNLCFLEREFNSDKRSVIKEAAERYFDIDFHRDFPENVTVSSICNLLYQLSQIYLFVNDALYCSSSSIASGSGRSSRRLFG
jgi:hypothetical protein